ncbi:undecaprenyl-phosphate glucose phosphotransferase [Bauldia litoralis]|uniref:Undecaprenyl-phosphate glucose phosphotransferase n=1 Tax=Bauldia litoralis TaxID=665467 RepID=A0A1G6BBD6_9HYPH|nr:undecaprenyl-phosphate glucose phosphotransferase [Bauldia litoralis]SDB17964.1 Undecaprenyl-phosphate glucose phosphotransferase [Bauldia litoralis]
MNEQTTEAIVAQDATVVSPPPALKDKLAQPPLNIEAELAAAALPGRSVSRVVVAGTVRLADFAIVVTTGFAIHLLYVEQASALAWWYLTAIIGAAIVFVSAMQVAGGYTIPAMRRVGFQTGRLLATWMLVFGVMTAVVFLAKLGEEFSRVWFTAWFVIGLCALIAFRVALASFVNRWASEGLLERRAVIVGGGERAEALINAMEAQGEGDIRICGIFDDRSDDRSPQSVAGYRKLGTISELVEFGRKAQIDLLIVSLPITAEGRVLQLLKQLWVLPVDIRLSAHTNKLRFRPRTYSFVGKVPFLDVVDKPIADWDVVAKWLFDHVVGAMILLLAAPVMLLVALAIRLDSRGPVLFKQKRYGFNNDLIEVYKFRSMYVDKTDATANKLVTRNDPRVTRVGRFIRRTSLDELPQLFNVVFKGNLSLVGPRPHAVQAKASDRLYGDVVDGYFARHRVKPGITGWAQINGWRGETDTEEKLHHRVEHDLFYIENWSVLFDLYIVLMTPFRLLNSENAY